jgi:hypothetical protein
MNATAAWAPRAILLLFQLRLSIRGLRALPILQEPKKTKPGLETGLEASKLAAGYFAVVNLPN